jgi:hypothetical protein
VRVDFEEFRKAPHFSCQMEGWDPETRWPTFSQAAELGIAGAATPADT